MLPPHIPQIDTCIRGHTWSLPSNHPLQLSRADVLFVLLHVTAQDLRDGAQDALEGVPVHLDALDIAAGRARGVALVVVQ